MVTAFSLGSKNSTPTMLSTQIIESRKEIATASASFSAIVVLISKYIATVETKSLIETDNDIVWLRI